MAFSMRKRDEVQRHETVERCVRDFYGMATDHFKAQGWDYASCASLLLRSGQVKVVQCMFDNLSEKDNAPGSVSDIDEAIGIAKNVSRLCKEYDAMSIVLAYRHPGEAIRIAKAAGADGIHYGWSKANDDGVSLARARDLAGERMIIGVTVESVEEVRASAEHADYFGTTALFPSALRSAQGALGWNGLRSIAEAAKETEKPLVVGGGVLAEHVSRIMDTEASGFFAISPLYSIPHDPRNRKDPEKTPEGVLQEYFDAIEGARLVKPGRE